MPRPRPHPRLPYTRRTGERQSLPYFRAAAIGGLLLATAACSVTGIDPAHTGSVVRASVADSVDPSDWEAVRRTLAGIGTEALAHAWQNPKTGSSGTITATAAEPGTSGFCRAFATTVADYRGIRRYRGEACQGGDGGWQLGGIMPEDSQFL